MFRYINIIYIYLNNINIHPRKFQKQCLIFILLKFSQGKFNIGNTCIRSLV